jgi:branched-chain amino acid transport system permease protein
MFKKLTSAWALHQKLVALVLLALAILFPIVFGNNPYIIGVGVMCGIYIILSLGLNLITGYMGIVSIGHAAFFGIGAYTAALLALRLHWNFIFTFLAAALMSALFGLLLGLPTLRLSGKYLPIVTLSFCEIARIVETNERWLTRGPLGLPGIPGFSLFGFTLKSPIQCYFLVLIFCGIAIYVVHSIMNSRVGRVITAIKNDEIAAESMGIELSRYKLLIFSVSSIFAGLAGAFYAHYVGFIDPTSFSADQSIQILSMIILGGMGNIYGSILGAVSLTALPELLRSFLSMRQVLYGALLVIMVLIRPQGILGGINLRHIKQQHDYNAKQTEEKEAEQV